MTKHADFLLRDLANAGELARRLLDRAGLDYCCSGNATLQSACEHAGLDVSAIDEELGSCDVEPDDPWARRGVTELIEHIVGVVHPRTKRCLEDLMAVRASLPKQEAAAREISDAIDLLAWHARFQMGEEEPILFARARELAEARKAPAPSSGAFRTIHDHRARLHEGHATTHEHLRRIRSLATTLADPAGERVRACIDAVASALTEQIHLENNELVPRALELEPNGQDVR
jgi:regulator of cell morphogenesis and NO signaling